MTICQRMFKLLDDKGKSAYGLCKKIGVGTGVMTGWKKRNTDPPAKFLKPISDYLEISIEYLCTGEETESNDFTLTDGEKRVIEKYRQLDEDGMDVVRGILIQEQRRVNSLKKAKNRE